MPDAPVIYVRVRGINVIETLHAFMNALVPHHGQLFMKDPEAFADEGYVSDTVEVHLHAAHDEDDARAIVRSVIDQLPGASKTLHVL